MSTKFILFFLYFSLSLEDCYKNCEQCTEYSEDEEDMKCTFCKENFDYLYGTSNCVDKNQYPSYFSYRGVLLHCSLFNSKCYECDPAPYFLGDFSKDICLSCIPGFIYNNETNECEKCKGNEYPFIYENFDECKNSEFQFCDLYTTECVTLLNEEYENLCKQYNDTNTCIIQNNNGKSIYVNWFRNNYSLNSMDCPSYNVDYSNNLLIELTIENLDDKKVKRVFYFYNEEGRGSFDPLNDKYEKFVEYNRFYMRYISTSIALKSENDGEFRYLLNFENYNNNLDFIDIKTGELYLDNIYDFLWLFDYENIGLKMNPAIQILELNAKNQFLIATYSINVLNFFFEDIYILAWIFSLDDSSEEKVDINSLKLIESYTLNFSPINFNKYNKFYFIQTKNGNLFLSFVSENNELYLYDKEQDNQIYIYNLTHKSCFQKLLLIKDEIKFLSYYSEEMINFIIFDYIYNGEINYLIESKINKYIPSSDNKDFTDVMFITDLKAVFIFTRYSTISIHILNFFNNYKYFMTNEFILNIYGEGLLNYCLYSLIFKYRDMIGFKFSNMVDSGFIIFGYYNSTDPPQILNIKKEGLNFNIILGNYLNLQSNTFEYEIKCIRITNIPDLFESGLYLVSNITKNFIKKDDCIDLNTNISLYFSYNGTLKKGNYLFKFVGVLQEPKYEVIQNCSDQTFWNTHNDELREKFIEEYDERRKMNISGRVALVQINILNNIKVFCDKKYDEFALKNGENELIACGYGKFYDVENANEITQLNLGINYYFDNKKNCYIKCHKKCKTCSKEFNETNMNCDECFENFFSREGNCLEISKCDYNYYYDKNYDLKCINRNIYCPDMKPYENKTTKECIENCNVDEFNIKCNPTNNLISIMDTQKKIFENIRYLKLDEKLFKKKEKYTIIGNNISFLFSTSDIEKEELFNNYNSSSIIIDNSIKEIKKLFLLPDNLPIPILKIETLNNNSNDIELYYEFFNSSNLVKNLDLNLLSSNYIEIRMPKTLKEYKMDLILKTKELGYNIFDQNDPFYNDICSAFIYNDSDFSLSERKNILDLSDENLCQIGCNFSNFDIKTLRTICRCKIGYDNNDTYISDTKKDDKNNENIINLFKSNMDISKSSNIKVVKCFSKIFTKKLFTRNYGFYIIFFMLLFNILILIFSPLSKFEKQINDYCIEVLTQMKEIYNNINKVETNENNNDLINENINQDINQEKEEVKTDIHNTKNDNINNELNNILKLNNSEPNNKHLIKNKKKAKYNRSNLLRQQKINLVTTNSSRIDKSNIPLDKNNQNKSEIEINKNFKDEQKLIKELKEKNNSDFYIYYLIKNIEKIKRKKYLSQSEMQSLSYKNALEIENRNKSKYYFALLKEKNKLISIFLNDKDYNPQSIKITSFIFNFNLSLTINALFYNDEAIYEINQEEAKSQISRVIYSAIISALINFIIELLAFTHSNIIKLRYYKEIKDAENEIQNLIKKLKLKYIIYYTMTIFLMVLFFYYITAFCSIYTIIQTNMIIDSLMSFLLTISYSIILSLISAIIRVFSLKKKNKFRHFLYLLSWIISLI